MIWPKVHSRRPFTGYNGEAAATTVKRGTFMYVAGEFAAAHAAPGTPGYANTGDLRMLIAAGAYIQSGNGCFPVDKFIYQLEGADVDLDTIASGQGMICYVEGEYETDIYNTTASGTGVAKGDYLWLDTSGLLTRDKTANFNSLKPIAWVKNVSDFPATNRWFNAGNTSGVDSYRKTLWYALYNYHDAPMYAEGAAAIIT